MGRKRKVTGTISAGKESANKNAINQEAVNKKAITTGRKSNFDFIKSVKIQWADCVTKEWGDRTDELYKICSWAEKLIYHDSGAAAVLIRQGIEIMAPEMLCLVKPGANRIWGKDGIKCLYDLKICLTGEKDSPNGKWLKLCFNLKEYCNAYIHRDIGKKPEGNWQGSGKKLKHRTEHHTYESETFKVWGDEKREMPQTHGARTEYWYYKDLDENSREQMLKDFFEAVKIFWEQHRVQLDNYAFSEELLGEENSKNIPAAVISEEMALILKKEDLDILHKMLTEELYQEGKLIRKEVRLARKTIVLASVAGCVVLVCIGAVIAKIIIRRQDHIDLSVDNVQNELSAIPEKTAEIVWERMEEEYAGAFGSEISGIEDVVKETADAETLLACGWKVYENENYEEALEYFTLSADKGNAEACNLLGTLYFRGEITDKNDEKAFSYFMAAKDKITDVYDDLAYFYYNGIATERNVDLALQYWKMAADAGNMISMYNLGLVLEDRGELEDALFWYVKALQTGYGDAGDAVNRISEKVSPVTKGNVKYRMQDYGMAVIYYSQAAKEGDAEGCCKLADCYYYGKGTEKDTERALELYKKAAEAGNSKAMYILADIAESEGREEEAVLKYQRAAEAGNEVAVTYLIEKGINMSYWYNKLGFDPEDKEKGALYIRFIEPEGPLFEKFWFYLFDKEGNYLDEYLMTCGGGFIILDIGRYDFYVSSERIFAPELIEEEKFSMVILPASEFSKTEHDFLVRTVAEQSGKSLKEID